MSQNHLIDYRRSEWIGFRKRVLERDGYTCVICGRGRDEVVLHVHHHVYHRGMLLWEYPLDAMETLCAGCHAAHHGKIPPRYGWEFIAETDLEEPSYNCDLCNTEIRYVFLVTHENWMPMEVGEMCCDRMTSTSVAGELMDQRRKFAGKLTRFVNSPRWDDVAGESVIKQGRWYVSVFRDGGAFGIKVGSKRGKMRFVTMSDARAHVFRVIESGEVESYFSRSRTHPYLRRVA